MKKIRSFNEGCKASTITIKVCDENCNDTFSCTKCKYNSQMVQDMNNNTICINNSQIDDYYCEIDNEGIKGCRTCYHTCSKCNEEGDEINHKCTECKESYPFHNIQNIEIFNCTEKCNFFVIENTTKCVPTCSNLISNKLISYDGKKCSIECDKDHQYIIKRRCSSKCNDIYKYEYLDNNHHYCYKDCYSEELLPTPCPLILVTLFIYIINNIIN